MSISPSSVAMPPTVTDFTSSGVNASSQTTNLAPNTSTPISYPAPPPESSPPPLPPADSLPPPADPQSPPPEALSPPPTVPSSTPPLPPATVPPSIPISPSTPSPLLVVAPPAGSPPSPPLITPPTAPVPPSIEAPVPPSPPLISSSPPPPSPLTNPPPDETSASPPPPASHSTMDTPPPTSLNQPDTGTPPAAASPPPPSPVTHPRSHSPQPTAPSPTSPASFSPPSPISPLPPVHSRSNDRRTQPSPLSSTGESDLNRTVIPTSNSGVQRAGFTATLVSCVIISSLALFIVAIWYNRRRRSRERFDINHVHTSPFTSSRNSASSSHKLNSSAKLAGSGSSNNFFGSSEHSIRASQSWFTYEELSDATNAFSSYNILGEGGFGCVYKGVLSDGRQVAVKRLKAGGGQGEREFKAEVETISRVHHRHLVSMVGYCISENQRLLVYDYVPNNTLHYHIHGENTPVMNWASRIKVAAGAARGIAYLHEDCQPRIIHRDIKSTNILLDNNFEAQVADFGLAKLALELELYTHVSTRVMGTFGYLAPEYASTGKLTEKSDVFSFGVVLLELITGRKPVDSSQPLGDESLVEWSRPLLAQAIETNTFDSLVDPKLGSDFLATEMYLMIEVAAACVRHSASRRPKMSQIVRAFDSMDAIMDLNNGMTPGQSGIFESREHSAQTRLLQKMAFGGSPDYSSDFLHHSQSSWRTH